MCWHSLSFQNTRKVPKEALSPTNPSLRGYWVELSKISHYKLLHYFPIQACNLIRYNVLFNKDKFITTQTYNSEISYSQIHYIIVYNICITSELTFIYFWDMASCNLVMWRLLNVLEFRSKYPNTFCFIFTSINICRFFLEPFLTHLELFWCYNHIHDHLLYTIPYTIPNN